MVAPLLEAVAFAVRFQVEFAQSELARCNIGTFNPELLALAYSTTEVLGVAEIQFRATLMALVPMHAGGGSKRVT